MEENEKSFTQTNWENIEANKEYSNKLNNLASQEFPLYVQTFLNLRNKDIREVDIEYILDIPIIIDDNTAPIITSNINYKKFNHQTSLKRKIYKRIENVYNPIIAEIKAKFYTNLDAVKTSDSHKYFLGEICLNSQNLIYSLCAVPNFNNYATDYNKLTDNTLIYLNSLLCLEEDKKSINDALIAEINSLLYKISRYYICMQLCLLTYNCYVDDGKIFNIEYYRSPFKQEFKNIHIDEKNIIPFILKCPENFYKEKNPEVYYAYAILLKNEFNNEFKKYYLHSFFKEQNYPSRNPFYKTKEKFILMNNNFYLYDNIDKRIRMVIEDDTFF